MYHPAGRSTFFVHVRGIRCWMRLRTRGIWNWLHLVIGIVHIVADVDAMLVSEVLYDLGIRSEPSAVPV